MAGAWGKAWGSAFGSAFGVVPGCVVTPTAQGAGGWSPSITSRYSDPSAYDPERVQDRLKFIEVAGRRFDTLDDTAFEAIEAYAMAVPDADNELARQEAKLAKAIVVSTGVKRVTVPVFRPMLDEMPDLKSAVLADLQAYANRVQAEIEEERRRIVLLLLDW